MKKGLIVVLIAVLLASPFVSAKPYAFMLSAVSYNVTSLTRIPNTLIWAAPLGSMVNLSKVITWGWKDDRSSKASFRTYAYKNDYEVSVLDCPVMEHYWQDPPSDRFLDGTTVICFHNCDYGCGTTCQQQAAYSDNHYRGPWRISQTDAYFTADEIRSVHCAGDGGGMRYLYFYPLKAASTLYGTVAFQDQAKDLGKVEELVDTTQVNTSEVDVRTFKPNVIVWFGTNTSTTRTYNTDDYGDHVWACTDTDQDHQCDYRQGQACLAAGGDWYKGLCCGTDITNCQYNGTWRDIQTIYAHYEPAPFRGTPSGDIDKFSATPVNGYVPLNITTLYVARDRYGGFLGVRDTPKTGYTALTAPIIYVKYYYGIIDDISTTNYYWTDYTLYIDTDINAYCGKNEDNKWQWAAAGDTGSVYKFSNCPVKDVAADGTNLYTCGGTASTNVLAWPSTPFVGMTIGSSTHDYFCNVSKITECRGDQFAFSNASVPTGSTQKIGSATYYCTENGSYSTDLDGKGKRSCEAAGFTWTGTKCCSEADDVDETYDDPGLIGACWKSTFVRNGQFVNNLSIVAVNGTLQGCGYASTPASSCLTPPSGMVRWFTGDGTVQDQTQTGGALTGDDYYEQGKVGQAFSFDGATILNAPSAADIEFGANQDFTIETWIRPAPVDVDWSDPLITNSLNIPWTIFHSQSLYALGNPNGSAYISYGDGYYLYYTPRGDLIFVVKTGLKSLIVAWQDTAYGHTFWENMWHHVAIKRSGDTMSLYVDGIRRGTPTTNINVGLISLRTGTGLNIGGMPGLGGSSPVPASYFNGSIDEVGMFNRALTDQEIKAISDAGSNGKCKTPGTSNSPTPCVSPPSDFISKWSGNGTSADVKGINDGTLQNGATYTAGKQSQAFFFDGVDDSIETSFNPNFPRGTITLWARPDDMNNRNMFGYTDSLLTAYSHTLSVLSTGKIYGYIWDGSPHSITSATTIIPGTWHHVVLTWNNGVDMKLYVDGKLEGTSPLGGAYSSGDRVFFGHNFGDWNYGLFNYFKGALDEIAVYNRELSASEIAANYEYVANSSCQATSTPQAPISTSPTNLPHSNPVCTVYPKASPSGDVFCRANGQWAVDSSNTNRSILKSIAWTDSSVLQSDCCNATACWTGSANAPNTKGGCQDDQTFKVSDPTSYHNYRCENGIWQLRILRYTWDKAGKGYCPREDQCLVDTSGSSTNNDKPDAYFSGTQLRPQCIANGQYLLDHFCENGIWSTRTKQIALYLLNYATSVSPNKYRLFCGTSQEALNIPTSVANYVGGASCTIGVTGQPCVNNFCVIETPVGVAWGVALNNKVNDNAKSFLVNPLGINASADDCDNAFGTPGYTECDGVSHLWYNPDTNSLISVPSGTIGGFSLTDFFERFIQNPFEALRLYVATKLQSPTNDFSFFNNTHSFNKLYAARDGSRQVFAFYEENAILRDAAGNVIIATPRDYIGVRFTNISLGTNPCIDLILRYDNLASCNSTATSINIVTDASKIPSPSRPKPITQAWRDITAKLRPG